MRTRSFSLGGTLAILNCSGWVVVTALCRRNPDLAGFLVPLLVFFSLPLAWSTLLPYVHGLSILDIAIACGAIGANALVWGRSLAWVAHRFRLKDAARNAYHLSKGEACEPGRQ